VKFLIIGFAKLLIPAQLMHLSFASYLLNRESVLVRNVGDPNEIRDEQRTAESDGGASRTGCCCSMARPPAAAEAARPG
jgi:hypothetical protein